MSWYPSVPVLLIMAMEIEECLHHSDHSLSMHAKFSGKRTFLAYVCVSGVRNVFSSEKFAHVLSEWFRERVIFGGITK